ncbi:hypothetical protein FSPOR_8225 [Fusarium sporotrichioides]|uniref:2EXR domain-containing protein n=1 Tax=Fusarium sporotrichioides TaxID=5514 RepID=A0A395RUR5_FUSSP|nr:hypothetical protein FSPOR_8225 [Fusarium sporotrichioides]
MDQWKESPPEPELYPGPHLELFNPVRASKSSDSFHLFPMLPLELRNLIWWQSLACERLITVNWHKEKRAVTNSSLISTTSVVSSGQDLDESPVLFANQESRRAALQFYRIRIPCYIPEMGVSRPRTKGILCFNPDFDIIHLSSRIDNVQPRVFRNTGLDDFVTFALELRNIDPQRLGLRKVAFQPLSLAREAFRTEKQSHQLRQVMSGISGVMFLLVISRHGYKVHDGLFPKHYRGIPIDNNHVCFQRLPQDPRPIRHDLKQRFGADAWGETNTELQKVRSFARHWNHLRDIMEVQSPCDHKPVIVSKGWDYHSTEILERLKSENWFLQSCLAQEKARNPTEKGEETSEELKAAPQTAARFWIFPQEALGPALFDGSLEPKEEPEILDLTAYHPELALFDLD